MQPGRKMNRKRLLLIFVTSLCAIANASFAEDIVINNEMQAALKKFNPAFAAWNTHDYSLKIQADARENKRQPYAVNLDFNKDGEGDLVLDGHDGKKDILLCLLSKSGGYDVVVLREKDLSDPEKIVNVNDGKKDIGLNYFLWPNDGGTGFTLAIPQQSDPEGKLISDGMMIDYIYKDGTFQESEQVL
jgi:hypothetical protein